MGQLEDRTHHGGSSVQVHTQFGLMLCTFSGQQCGDVSLRARSGTEDGAAGPPPID